MSTYTTIGWIRILDGWMVKVGFYCFPSPEDNRWFIIYLMEFGDIKEDTYEDAYWKVLASIRSKE